MSYFLGSRTIPTSLLDSLRAEPLYKNHLKGDIQSGEVFPAFRRNRIDFYYKGGKLFQYDGKFATHIKFASVIIPSKPKDYVTETDLSSTIVPLSNFSEGYSRIKENCKLYSGDEDIGISDIYHSFTATKKSKIIVLDIEIAFSSKDEDKRTNRIDMLLFNTESRVIRFYEAKDFYNKELWSAEGKAPQVISQIKRYEEQISKDRDFILQEYTGYTNLLNELCGTDLKPPVSLDEHVCLLIFGFDANQKYGRLDKLLLSDNSLQGIMHYEVGDTKTAKITSIWNQAKCD